LEFIEILIRFIRIAIEKNCGKCPAFNGSLDSH